MTNLILAGNVSYQSPPGEWNINGLTFDAWLRLGHNTSLTITQHPVEAGAPISDHSYVNPKRWTFDLGVSNVNQAPNFAGSSNRNINAYNTLVDLQAKRELLALTCKYGSYEDVLIESIDVSDDWQTKEALMATVNLVQLIIADSKFFEVSQKPHTTDQTNRGKVSPVPALGTWERVMYDWNQVFR